MIFSKKQDYVSADQINGVLGGTARFDLTREFPIESIFLIVTATVSTAAATLNADGLLALIRRVTLSGPDGARTRNVVDASGPGLIELAYQWSGYLDRDTRARINGAASAAASYTFVVPIYFCPPNISDPLAAALLLPVDRYNANPSLNIQFGTQADLDVNGTPTFAISALNVVAQVNRRVIDRKNWPILDTELFELQKPYTASGDNQSMELPIPGNYTGILLRCYTSASARGDISPASSDWDLRLSGTVLRRFRLLDIQRENDFSTCIGTAATDALNGSYFLDFVADRPGADGGDVAATFGSLLNANIPLTSGSRLNLRQNITGGSAVQVKYLCHRIFGNLAAFKK